MLRLTHRRKHSDKSLRRTRRLRYRQHGGAVWYVPAEPRLTDWRAELTGTPFAPLVDASVTDEAHFAAWVAAIERQDDLFGHGLSIIAKKVGVTLGDTDGILAKADEIDGQRAAMMEYLTDVEKFLYFTPDTEDPSNRTKLQMIRGEATESLTTLLLFPDRVRNVFLYAIANIFVLLKTDTSGLLEKAASSAAVRTVLAAQYKSYSEALAATLTAEPLRDGFFTNQGIPEFRDKDLKSFWSEFLNEVLERKAIEGGCEKEAVFRGTGGSRCIKDATTWTWGKVAAHLFCLYSTGQIGELLSLFSQPAVGCVPAIDEETAKRVLPEKTFWSLPLRSDGATATLQTVLTAMDDTTFQFLLQLSHMIGQVEGEKRGEETVTHDETAPPSS